MSYTKGEWEAKGSRVVIPNKEGFIPTSQWPVFVIAQTSTYCNVDGEEAEANAYLIAAAPDMYEALKIAEARIHNEIRHHPEAGDYRKMLQNELRQVSKALAKAEGK